MVNIAFDNESYKQELLHAELKVVPIAATPLIKSQIIPADLDPSTPQGKLLEQALRVYEKHYVVDGIIGESETRDIILSRLRGNDPNIERMTILGVQDKEGKIVGVSFIETYKIPEVEIDGKKEEGGLGHLHTYTAINPPYDKSHIDIAVNAAVLDAVVKIDKELGYEGKSALVNEVNSVRDEKGHFLTDNAAAMDAEFRKKTGLGEKFREEYDITGENRIITLKGKYADSEIVNAPYYAPNLKEPKGKIDSGLSASDVSALMVNEHQKEGGGGEPMFITNSILYKNKTPEWRDAMRKETVHKHLYRSVITENLGISPELADATLAGGLNPDYQKMIDGWAKASKTLATPQREILMVSDSQGMGTGRKK